MKKITRLLRYDWPLHFILLLTNWLPDNVLFLRLRGYFVRPFLGSCGKNFRIGRNLTFYNPSQIIVGKDVYIAYGSWFSADSKIQIEDEVTIGPYCVFASSNYCRRGNTYFDSDIISSEIQIGTGCWLGAHCVITAGCTIGAGCLIGAGAVCTGTIPGAVLAGGVPAIIIKKFDGDTY